VHENIAAQAHACKAQALALGAADLNEASRFLEALSGGDVATTRFVFQTFDDSPAKRRELARVLHSTLMDAWPTLAQLQLSGAGVFVTIALTSSGGRKKTDWLEARAVFREDDEGAAEALPLPPHVVVESSPGKRHEYLLTRTTKAAEWETVMARMVADHGSDPNAKDLVRVLRLPGTWHLKNFKAPTKVRILALDDRPPYAWEEITTAIPPMSATSIAPASAASKTSQAMPGRGADADLVQQIASGENYHGALLTLTARYRSKGMSDADVIAVAQGLMEAANDGSDRWQSRYSEIPRMVLGAAKFAPGATYDKVAGVIAAADLLDEPRVVVKQALEMMSQVRNLTAADESTLLGLLKKATDTPLRALREDLAKLRSSSARVTGFDPKLPVEVAKALISEDFTSDGTATIRRWQGSFYAWDGRRYVVAIDEDVRSALYDFLQRSGVDVENRSQIDNAMDALRAESNIAAATVAPSWTGADPPDDVRALIACGNGLLNPHTRQLIPHSPQLFSTNAIDVDYLPEAPPPSRWLQFLGSVLPDDPQAIAALQEWFGYCLTHDTSLQKALIIVGPKRSGKGTLARVLQRLLGEFNVCGPTLGSLGSQFGLQPLIGKLLAIVSDARVSGAADLQSISENMLRVTGEDLVNVPRKNMADWSGKLDLRFMLLTNVLPGLIDSGGAIASRFVVLQLSQSFYGREDTELTPKLLAELPGILNWSLDGLARLKARGALTQPASGEEAMRDLRRRSSPVTAFSEDTFEPGQAPGCWVSKDAVHQLYREWCADQGMSFKLPKDQMLRELYAADDRFQDQRPRGPDGTRIRAVSGARLRATAFAALRSAAFGPLDSMVGEDESGPR
jgi:putative DNA primase/helicase